MPPRIPLVQPSTTSRCLRATIDAAAGSAPNAASSWSSSALSPSLASLFGALSLQTRQASILANLSDNPGAHQKRIRKGRGPSSGYGKTSGRGHKGQGQHGKVRSNFQGGQTPLIVTWGKKGFKNHRAPVMSEVNLDKLQEWIDAGRIDATRQITPKELIESGLIGSPRDGVKLLARGGDKLRTAVNIVASRASSGAIDAIEAVGGKVVTRYYTKFAIKSLLKGESVHTSKPLPVGEEHVNSVLGQFRARGPNTYRLPDPTSRWDMEYYRDPAHRGYLSHQIKPGESPSLYFKVPKETFSASLTVKEREKKKKLAADTLW